MIRIVIAEDEEMILGVIGSLLHLEEDMEVVGRARNGEEAVMLVHELQPDVCIMDIEMPKMSGLDAAEALMSTGCKIIMLTTFFRTGYVERAMRADVRGYLLKDDPSEKLICSIRGIMDGKRIYSSELIGNHELGTESNVNYPIANKTFHQDHHIQKVKKYLSIVIDKMRVSVR